MGSALGLEPSLAAATQATLDDLDARIAALSDPWCKKILTNWRDHYWGEATADLELVMGTLTPNPAYRFYGSRVIGPPQDVDTTEEVRAMYGGLMAMGFRLAGPLTGLRFAFANWGLTMEAFHTAVFPGAIIHVPGMAIDPKAAYRVTNHLLQSHPYDRDSGLMMGEIASFGDPTEVTRIER